MFVEEGGTGQDHRVREPLRVFYLSLHLVVRVLSTTTYNTTEGLSKGVFGTSGRGVGGARRRDPEDATVLTLPATPVVDRKRDRKTVCFVTGCTPVNPPQPSFLF